MDQAQACMMIGVRVVEIMLANTTDAQLKARLEQERSRTVSSTAEACMKNNWDAELRRCFLGATTPAQFEACNARAPGQPGRPTRGS